MQCYIDPDRFARILLSAVSNTEANEARKMSKDVSGKRKKGLLQIGVEICILLMKTSHHVDEVPSPEIQRNIKLSVRVTFSILR
jgi:hypothetical protein